MSDHAESARTRSCTRLLYIPARINTAAPIRINTIIRPVISLSSWAYEFWGVLSESSTAEGERANWRSDDQLRQSSSRDRAFGVPENGSKLTQALIPKTGF